MKKSFFYLVAFSFFILSCVDESPLIENTTFEQEFRFLLSDETSSPGSDVPFVTVSTKIHVIEGYPTIVSDEITSKKAILNGKETYTFILHPSLILETILHLK